MKKALFVYLAVILVAAAARPQDIFEALGKGDIPAVRALIEKSPELLDSRDGNGMTPLHYAARGGNAELITYLIDKGAKLEAQTAQVKTPLHLAAMNDLKDAVAVLLKRGAGRGKRGTIIGAPRSSSAPGRGDKPRRPGSSLTPARTSTRSTNSATRRSRWPPGAASGSSWTSSSPRAPRFLPKETIGEGWLIWPCPKA
ncbi:MAG: ankyrin repeat domain-containing protein [Candidatus Aminicenantales bacterium]